MQGWDIGYQRYPEVTALTDANEWRLSAAAQTLNRAAAATWQINLVGMNRREIGDYGDCKLAGARCNRLA